jgi:tetratricopeptide (TPR) repeat protein
MSPEGRLFAAVATLALFGAVVLPRPAPVPAAIAEGDRLAAQSLDAVGRGAWAEALAPTTALVERFPNQQVYAERLARVHHALGRPEAEAAAWEKFVAISPTPDDACPALGEAYQRMGDAARALDAFVRCRDFDPGSAELAFHLARAYERRGRWADARRAYEGALAVDPAHGDSRVRLAALALRSGQPAEALAQVEPLLPAVVRDPDAHLLAGLAYQRLGRRAEARQALERALALVEGYGDAHLALGILEFADGRPQAARPHFERALALDPGRADEVRVWLDRTRGAAP